jgi:hypothetical protein
MKYFQDCRTIDDLKSKFKELAKKHHPDLGGDVAVMQEINNEYSYAVAYFAKHGDLGQRGADNQDKTADDIIRDNETYMNAITAIIHLPLIVELVGSWIWVSGNTYPYRDNLHSAGFFWASAKKMWYFRPDDKKCKSYGKGGEIGEIRAKYGSKPISPIRYNAIAG